MARLGINTGSTPNDGTGDTLVDGGFKINTNFVELYNLLGDGTNLSPGIVTSIVAGDNISIDQQVGEVTITGGITTAEVRANTLNVTGVSTLGSSNGIGTVTIGIGTTALLVDGNTRVIGILTVGRDSVTIDGSGTDPFVQVGGGVTIMGTSGGEYIMVGSNMMLDAATGIITATEIHMGNETLTGVGNTLRDLTVTGVSTFNNSVGIGTDNITAPLTVMSSTTPRIRIGYNDSQDHSIAWDSSKLFLNADPDNANGSSAIGFRVDGDEKVRITDGGNVGIGTNDPEEILHILGPTEAVANRDGVMIQHSTASAGADTGLPLVWSGYVNSGSPNYGLASICGRKENGTDGNAAAYLQFATCNSAGALAERARITSTGVVGVGTVGQNWRNASYVGVLQVAHGSLSAQDIDDGATSIQNNAYFDTTNNRWEYIRNDPAEQISFTSGVTIFNRAVEGTADGAITWSESARISAGGSFGIGTNDPKTPLDVVGIATGSGGKDVARFCTDPSDSSLQQSISVGFSKDVDDVHPMVRVGAFEFDTGDRRGSLVFATRESNSDVAPTEKMRITSDGDVGIGTDNPDATLHVEGIGQDQLKLTASGTGCKFYMEDIGTTADIYLQTLANDLRFVVNGGERVRISAGGSFGIGTNDPTSKLQIGDANVSSDNVITLGKRVACTQTSLPLIGHTSDGVQSDLGLCATSSGGSIRFYTGNGVSGFGDNNNSEKMRVTSGGDVGIGTEDPSDKLHVYGTSETNIRLSGNSTGVGCYLLLQNTDPSNASATAIQGLDGSGQGITEIKSQSTGDANNEGYLTFSTRQASQSLTARMRITNDGDVRIGDLPTQDVGSTPGLQIGHTGTPQQRFVRNDNTMGDGDVIGEISSFTNAAQSAQTYNRSGSIKFKAADTLTQTNRATKISFEVAPNNEGNEAPIERLVILPNGDIDVVNGNVKMNSGKGIDFSDTSDGSGTMSSELLDDYEEGTFTPFFTSTSATGSGDIVSAYDIQMGSYTKVGNTAHIDIYLQTSATSWSYQNGGANSQTLRIGGLPFSISSDSNYYPAASCGFFTNWTTWSAGYSPMGYGVIGGTQMQLVYSLSNTSTNITTNYINSLGSSIIISMTYKV